MSEQNGKVCANCRHCKREKLNGYTRVYCEIDGWALSYVKVMSGWCRHWGKEREVKMERCGWIRVGKGYITSCGHKANYHRGYAYCPFCAKVIVMERRRNGKT